MPAPVIKKKKKLMALFSVLLSSVAQSCLTLCNLTDCNTPGFPVHHQLPDLAQIHVHRALEHCFWALLWVFLMMYSAYKLNKHSDNIHPWCTPFPIWNQSVVPCPFLTAASWPAYRFLKRQVRWSSIHLFQNFPQFVVIHTVKGFGIVNKAEIDAFLELSCFFDDPAEVGNLISGSSAFSKTSLNIWKFTVHVLLKLGLENFKHCFTSMCDECNC